MLVVGFRLHNGQGIVGAIAQYVVSTLLPASFCPATHEHNTPIGKRALLVDHMGRVVPACFLKQRNDEFPASVGFSEHDRIHSELRFGRSLPGSFERVGLVEKAPPVPLPEI
jgi:hypothetical protein